MRTLISLLLAVMLLGTVCAHAEKDSSLGITQKTLGQCFERFASGNQYDGIVLVLSENN